MWAWCIFLAVLGGWKLLLLFFQLSGAFRRGFQCCLWVSAEMFFKSGKSSLGVVAAILGFSVRGVVVLGDAAIWGGLCLAYGYAKDGHSNAGARFCF